MYFTRLAEASTARELGELVRESRCILFLRLGDRRTQLPERFRNAFEFHAESITSPVVDCDREAVDWPALRSALQTLGKVFKDLDEGRPFVLAVESRNLADEGRDAVPCLIRYIDLTGVPNPPEVSDALGEAFLDAFGPLREWALDDERRSRSFADRLGIMTLLAQIASFFWKP